jgi:small subunit ribosomal protein S16
MPVKIRLTKRGRRNLSIFDIVVADSRSPRDGKFIEKLGLYNPVANPAIIEFDEEKAFKWVMDGAQATDTVRNILSDRGLMLKKHLQVGVNKGAITQEVADKKFNEWKKAKEAKLTSATTDLTKKKEDAKKAKLAAEAKVNEARKEAIKAKKVVAETPAPAETPAAPEEPKAE